jgi:dephospho-CoA kinase
MKGISLIVGQKGSGKSTVLNIINALGFYTTELAEHLKYLEFEGKRRTDLEGDCWSDSAISLACENGLRNFEGQVFLSGIARPSEIEYLQKESISYEIISISVDENLRYKRTRERGRQGEENLSLSKYQEMCERRLGNFRGYESNDLNGLMRLSNFNISNEGTFEDLYLKTKDMMLKRGHIV